MKVDTYFKKNGEIYGIEMKSAFCGKADVVIRFTDFNTAQRWVTEKVGKYRFLGTKADAKNIK